MDSIRPTVSVIIPAYNAERWIGEAIASVLSQTYRELEIIVVDDGSSDATCRIVKDYGDSVIYLHKSNGGQGSARNTGILNATGQYIAFLDADDAWLPTKLEVQMKVLGGNSDLQWVYSDALVFEGVTGRQLYVMGDKTKMQFGGVLRPLLLHDFIPSSTPVVKRAVFDHVGLFDEALSLRGVEDWDMWLRIAARCEVGFVNQPLVRYRVHATSTTSDLDRRLRGVQRVVERALAREPQRLSDLSSLAYANVWSGIGQWLLKRGKQVEARYLFADAIRSYPKSVKFVGYWLITFLPTCALAWLDVLRPLMIGLSHRNVSRKHG